MNIVTPILNAIAYPTANINTESARRDNVQRETIPQTSDAEQGASQKGLGSEADKAKSPGQPPAPVTYERPQVQTELQAAFQNVFGQDKDNAQDESAGKQDAQSEQQARQREQQQEQQDTQEIEQLKARDQEVRTHEQAHAATGGQYAGSPQYEYTTGPDNKRYVTDGEVSIDISEAQNPEQTLRKMQQVRAAALAPAQPSSQDLKVAAEAAQKAFEARSDIAEENREARESESSEGVSASEPTIPSIDDITDTAGVERPTRSLDDAVLKTEQGNSSEDTSQGASSEVGTRSLNFGNASELNGDNAIQARIGRIQNTYTQAYTPAREGLSLQA
ncbi:hypothetical protein LHL20_00180 [Alteromonas sp. McT4-15]|uniref:putative metalloprotease CJM1_0395 family protein n=1 Tax=Alteromonas sp. McT4-15 TaxID=2881256 RepID=UPI001CF8AE6C|nr:putative metalloprotease CJM1_0395 family protein [Alteromonas sp. McT4-15]MCB4434652.1 hypothetical protein [Alteromonas sp. McT4-15]MEC8230433.1 putative metalloprotease CJM1_0395 family protein [Pseudomonadota bacterium]